MKIELSQQVGVKQKLEYLLDVFIEKIIDVGDFLFYKHVTLSEVILYGLALFRAIWFSIFGVENANYEYFFPDWVWIVIFVLVTLIHTVGFFIARCSLRVISAYCYTFIWGFLTALAAYSGTNAPAVPTLSILSLLGFVMIIRLTREYKKDAC